MTAIEFRNGIIDWLHKYGFTNVKSVVCHTDSAYDMENHEIRIGLEKIENVDEWFEEFLIERGLGWENIPSPVLQFLHELGHSQTVHDYTQEQLMMCRFLKDFIGPTDVSKESAIKYWKIMDELAANEWLINFANKEIDAIAELCQWFIDHWEDSIDDLMKEVWNSSISENKTYT